MKLREAVAALLVWVTGFQCLAQERPEVFVRTGHTALVQALALSPDGKVLAASDFSGQVKLWDTESRLERGSLGPMNLPLISLAWSPDGTRLFAGNTGGWLATFDIEKRELVAAWRPLKSGEDLWAIAVRNDGLIALCGQGTEVVIYDERRREVLKRLELAQHCRSLVFSADGRTLISGDLKHVTVWDSATWLLRRQIEVDDAAISLALSSDERSVYVGFGSFVGISKNSHILRYSLQSGERTGELRGFEGAATRILVTPDGRTAVSTIATNPIMAFMRKGGSILEQRPGNQVLLWDLREMRLIRPLGMHSAFASSAALDPVRRRVFSGSWDRTIQSWNLDGAGRALFAGRINRPSAAIEVGGGRHFATLDQNGDIGFWQRDTGELIAHKPAGLEIGTVEPEAQGMRATSEGVQGLIRYITPNAKWRIAFTSSTPNGAPVKRELALDEKLATDALKASLLAEATTPGALPFALGGTAQFVPGSNECDVGVQFNAGVMTHGRSGIVRWSCAGDGSVRLLPIDLRGSIEMIAPTSGGNAVLVARQEWVVPGKPLGGRKHFLELVRVATGEVLWRREKPAGIGAMDVTADGRFALVGVGAEIEWTNLSTGDVAKTLSGHTKGVSALRLVGNSRKAISGGFDQRIVLWDVEDGKAIGTLWGHTGGISSLNVTSDLGRMISSASDRTMRIWDARDGAQLALFSASGTRDWVALTPEGYFAGSEGGIEQLGFRVGNAVYGLDQFYDSFYRPDILRRRLAGESIAGLAKVNVADAIRQPPPDVEVGAFEGASDAPQVGLAVVLRSRGGGIGRMRIFQNGKLVVEESLASSSQSVSRQIRIKPVEGENEITVVAFNQANTVQAPARKALFKSSVRLAPPRIHAVVFGVDDFAAGRRFKLSFAEKDAADFVAALRGAGNRLLSGQLGEVRVLVGSAGSRSGLLAALRDIARIAGPQDTFMLFAASHGVFSGDAYGLATREFNGTFTPGGLLQSSELLAELRAIPAQRQLVVLDTCHAGSLDIALQGLYDARITLLARNIGLHMLASAGTYEEAIDGFEDNGLFTHVLLKGLLTPEADANRDKKVSALELAEHVKSVTPKLAREVGHRQNPLANSVGMDFGIVQFGPN